MKERCVNEIETKGILFANLHVNRDREREKNDLDCFPWLDKSGAHTPAFESPWPSDVL